MAYSYIIIQILLLVYCTSNIIITTYNDEAKWGDVA